LKEPLDAKPFGKVTKRTYTKIQSFNAMVDFLIHYYQRTLPGDLNELNDIICSFPENTTDQASWTDWNNAAKKALQRQAIEKTVDETMEKKLTKLQAFNAMVKFLDKYYEETASDFMGAANDPEYYLGPDKHGKHCYAKISKVTQHNQSSDQKRLFET